MYFVNDNDPISFKPPQYDPDPGFNPSGSKPGYDCDPGLSIPRMDIPNTAIPMPTWSPTFDPEPRTPGYPPYGADTPATEPVKVSAPYWQNANEPTGPARTSEFINPKTGAFDYGGFMNAGMACSEQAGDKGNLFLLDDSPEYMHHYGIRDKPSVLISGGGPGYAVPQWRLDEGGPYVPSTNEDWVRPVGMKAGKGDEDGTGNVQGGEQAPAATTGGGSQSSGQQSTVNGGQQNGEQQHESPAVAAVNIRPDLGESVKRFESGTRGVAEVSSGVNDPGGVSYGSYQLSSKKGTVMEFLTSQEGSKYGDEFAGLTPGTPEFSAKWKEIAARDPEGLHQAEKAFIYQTHYQPLAEKAAKLGFDMSNPAIQDAVWSGSIQHRKFGQVLDAANAADTHLKYRSPDDQLRTLYSARSAYTNSLSTVPPSAGRLRYANELPAVLARNEAYQQARRR